MGFGGARKSALDQQLALIQAQQAQLAQQQQSQQQTYQQSDQVAQQRARTQQQQAKAQTQKRSKLKIFDAIRTSPQGLLNEPNTGKLTLLGN